MALWISGIGILSLVASYFVDLVWVVILASSILAFYAYRLIHHRSGNYFMITSRRIIKSIVSGVSDPHTKEVRLESVKQMTSVHRSLAGKMFKYGSLHINPGSDAIRFRGMPLHSEVESYLARIVDYLRTNPPTDELTPFASRKERYTKKGD